LIGGCGKKGGDENQAQSTGQETGQTAPQSGQATVTQSGTSAQSPGLELSADAAKNKEVLTQLNQGKEIAAVTADTLKGLLPEPLAGMKRTSASAERSQVIGMDTTTAEGEYEGQDGATLDLTITDIGNMAGALRTSMTAWASVTYDRKTATGYEKTGTYGGHKGVEEYNDEDKYGAIRVVVADRFLIELEGNDVTMDTMKKALDEVDLKKLAALASGS